MRTTLKELTDKLGVGQELSAYQTFPWSAYDDEKGVSCSAEVRMNSDANELEAEMQIMRDDPQEGELPFEHIYSMMAMPAAAGKWDVKRAIVKGKDNAEDIHGWAEKTVNFFHACVQELKMGKIPDIDEILKRELKDDERFGGKRGGGASRKSPKIKPQALLGMKNGGGM